MKFLMEKGASVNAQDNVSINSKGKYGIDLKVYKVIQFCSVHFACYRYYS